MRHLLALVLLLSSGAALADGSWLDGGPYGVHFRVGGLSVVPTAHGGPVELSNVSGPARLSGLADGPIAGSSTRVGKALMVAAIVGYAPPILNRQLSFETILALPFKQKLYAGGTLANESLAPNALGSLPTGVPPLGSEIGEVTVLSPVLTAVYRFFPGGRLRPYLGAGGCLLVVLDTKITNPVLASVRAPRVDTSPRLGWVVQAGTEVRFGGRYFLTADVKYVGGLAITSRMRNVSVSVPKMPLYGSTSMGDAISHTRVDPIVSFLGVGMDL
jgi:outer membrane protein W